MIFLGVESGESLNLGLWEYRSIVLKTDEFQAFFSRKRERCVIFYVNL